MNYWNGFLWKKESASEKKQQKRKNWQDRLHAVIEELNRKIIDVLF